MDSKNKVVILGAGVGGLSAGYFLARTGRYDITVLEQEPYVGGLCGSFKHAGFTLDYGPHKLYSVIPGILDEIKDLMGGRLARMPKRNSIYLKGHLLNYPLELNNLAFSLGPAALFKLGADYVFTLASGLLSKREIRSYRDYMLSRFGKSVYKLIFEPLAEKVWGRPYELHSDMARVRVPAQGGLEVISKLLGLRRDTHKTNAESFFYPKGGFFNFSNALKEGIEAHGGRVIFNAKVSGLARSNNRISQVMHTISGKSFLSECDYCVSSILIKDLAKMAIQDNDQELNLDGGCLQFRHLILVYLFIKRPAILKDQWIFFPEEKFIFSRIFEQKQMGSDLGPADSSSLCCDFTCEEDSWQWKAPDDELAKRCVEGLVFSQFIKKEEVTGYLVKRKRDFYPRYDLLYKEKVSALMDKLKETENLLLTGRIGMYNYNNADHCVGMGKFISDKLVSGIPCRQIIDEMLKNIAEYKIVD